MIENILLHEIKDNVAWIIELCFGEKKLYTLHYDAERSASVLHTSENAVAFASIDDLIALCHEKHLNLIDGERISRSFNFDIELVKKEYEELDSQIAIMQIELDKFNQTFEFEVDI